METASNSKKTKAPIALTTEASSTGFSDRDSSTVTTPSRAVKGRPDDAFGEFCIPDREPDGGLWKAPKANALVPRVAIAEQLYFPIQFGRIRMFINCTDLHLEMTSDNPYAPLPPRPADGGLWRPSAEGEDTPIVSIAGVRYFCVQLGNYRAFAHVEDTHAATPIQGVSE